MIRPILLLLAASSLTACDSRSEGTRNPDEGRNAGVAQLERLPLRKLYQSTFPKTSPDCCLVDELRGSPKDLAIGQSNEGETISPDLSSGTLKLTAPPSISADPDTGETKTPAVGFFRTGLDYGPHTAFSVRATFRNPDGPLNDKAWAVGVAARDGELDDRYNATRLSVTLRVRRGRAALNIGAGADPDTKPEAADIGDDLFRSIFNEDQPFTLELYVDRKRGHAIATLTVGTETLTQRFTPLDFKKDSGPAITTVGAALADCCVPGATVSVEVINFQIWGQKP